MNQRQRLMELRKKIVPFFAECKAEIDKILLEPPDGSISIYSRDLKEINSSMRSIMIALEWVCR
jgi:hypothetical protein